MLNQHIRFSSFPPKMAAETLAIICGRHFLITCKMTTNKSVCNAFYAMKACRRLPQEVISSIALKVCIRGGYRQQPRDTIRIPIQGSRYDTCRDTCASRYMGHDTIRIAIHGLQYNTYPVFLGLYFQKLKLFFNVVSYPGPHVLVV